MMMTFRSSSIRFSSSSVAIPSRPGHHDVDDRGVERQRARHLEPSAPDAATRTS
jgi:hypothetical protein